MSTARDNKIGSLGYHDVGGLATAIAGPLPTADQVYLPWERQIHALRLVLGTRGLISSDELRRAIEALDVKRNPSLHYYDKWLLGIIAILIERKVITGEELNAQFESDESNSQASEASEAAGPKFKVGDIVCVRREVPGNRWRKPHLRTPGYLHGCSGTITRINGSFIDPSYAAYREHLPPSRKNPIRQILYTVVFRAIDVWGTVLASSGRGGAGDDAIYADVFESWLMKTDALKPQAHHFHESCDAGQKKVAGGGEATATGAAATRYHHHHHHDAGEDEHHHHAAHSHSPRAVIEATAVEKELKSSQSPFADLAETLLNLLVAKSILTRLEVHDQLAALDAIPQQRLGAKLVARAWADPQFKQQLLADAEAAANAMGIGTSNYKDDANMSLDPRPRTLSSSSSSQGVKTFPHGHTVLKVVENTATVHNLVVCTLCSCYPVAVLGLSPDWYKSASYRARAVSEPRALLRDVFGLEVPMATSIAVHDSTAELRYLVLPMRPVGTDGWTVERLEQLVTRDSMIGVALPKAPQQLQANL